jgi:membrane protein
MSKPASRLLGRMWSTGAALSRRIQVWADRQDPRSVRGVLVGGWQRYRTVDGPSQTALLALYVLVAVLPAVLVMEELQDTKPSALAKDLAQHYGLSGVSARLLRGVLVQDRRHELGTAVLAIVGALVFGGLGFGRVLQRVNAGAWGITATRRQADQVRYAAALFGIYGLILLLLVQLNHLSGGPSGARLALAPAWIALLVFYFTWMPRVLTRGMIPWRELLPGAVLSALGLVLLMWISSFAMEAWIDLYAKDYGGFGVVLAIYFWLALMSSVIVASACIAPALAERKRLRAV